MSTADEVFESWEEMEASGALDRKLNSLELNGLEGLDNQQNIKLVNSKNTNGRMTILGDDGLRSQYVSPIPTVKILKRPQRDIPDALTNGDKPKQPIKSLKQREQEYAEARKRILGEEKSPEELTSSLSSTTTINDIGRIQSKTNTIYSPASALIPLFVPHNSPQVSSNVLRMPSGPDGTQGFNIRR